MAYRRRFRRQIRKEYLSRVAVNRRRNPALPFCEDLHNAQHDAATSVDE